MSEILMKRHLEPPSVICSPDSSLYQHIHHVYKLCKSILTGRWPFSHPLHTVHDRAVIVFRSPIPEPHLRGRRCWMEIVNVIHGVWVRVITGPDSQVTTLLPVRADVFPQRCGLLEAAVAEGATTWPFSSVDELVVLEVLQATQALSADGANIGFLASVCAPVFAQTVQVAEGVSAL